MTSYFHRRYFQKEKYTKRKKQNSNYLYLIFLHSYCFISSLCISVVYWIFVVVIIIIVCCCCSLLVLLSYFDLFVLKIFYKSDFLISHYRVYSFFFTSYKFSDQLFFIFFIDDLSQKTEKKLPSRIMIIIQFDSHNLSISCLTYSCLIKLCTNTKWFLQIPLWFWIYWDRSLSAQRIDFCFCIKT